jgi:hypothetical protein
MAIPTWLADDTWGEPTDRPDPASLDRTADAVGALAHAVRLEFVTALAREGPSSHSDLEAATAVADNGQFNYHLRRLDGFVRERNGAYELTDAGDRVHERLLRDGPFADISDE